MHPPILSAIFIYPVKSLTGVSMEESELTKEGLLHDRRWMLVDETGKFLSQRTLPRMTKIGTRIDEKELYLFERDNPGNEISVSLNGTENKIQVRIWENDVIAAEENSNSAKWLSDFLGMNCKLVKMAPFSSREVDPKYAPGHKTGFADGYPLLLMNESSLDFLNEKLDAPVRMNRFRPNLVVKGLNAFGEDEIAKFNLGPAELECVKPCGRCVLINVSPENADTGLEPLKTLARFRSVNNKVNFGQNVIVNKPGILKTGMNFQF